MPAPQSHLSPRALARIGGALYLAIILIGIFGEMFVRGSLVVPGDAAATVERIQASETLWRVGAAGEFTLLVCAVCLTIIFYILLRPVSRDLALLAVSFNLVSIAIEAVGGFQLVAALFPLGNSEYLKVLGRDHLAALAYLSIRSHGYLFGVALLFFGFVCIVLGHLIRKSGYFPAWIGVLMQLAGLAYLVNSYALVLAPRLASQLNPWILLPSLVGEASLCLWLLFRGPDPAKWEARIAASRG